MTPVADAPLPARRVTSACQENSRCGVLMTCWTRGSQSWTVSARALGSIGGSTSAGGANRTENGLGADAGGIDGRRQQMTRRTGPEEQSARQRKRRRRTRKRTRKRRKQKQRVGEVGDAKRRAEMRQRRMRHWAHWALMRARVSLVSRLRLPLAPPPPRPTSRRIPRASPRRRDVG